MKNIIKQIAIFTIILFVFLSFTACSLFNSNARSNPGNATSTGISSTDALSDDTQSSNTLPSDTQSTSIQPTSTVSTETTIPGSSQSNTSNTGTQSGTTQTASDSALGFKVKALYLTGWTAGSAARLDHFIQLAKSTEINTYVIDIKDEDGLVSYESSVKSVRDIGAWTKKYDVGKVIAKLHENNIHVIGRIVCFNDPVLSSKIPEYAIKTKSGAAWLSKNSDGKLVSWVNPYETGAWDYLIDIAKEGIEKGFDEIQFDYVRFPSGKNISMYFGANPPAKYQAIDEFLGRARKAMPDAILSADVFGIICESPADSENIGQNLEMIGKDLDYISPMVYPSHFAPGQIVNGVTFSIPDFKPYDVVYNSLIKAKNRISKITDGYKAKIRPYLQDFTASYMPKGTFMEYGPVQVRQQISAAYDTGCQEWILWDAKNTYDESALLPK